MNYETLAESVFTSKSSVLKDILSTLYLDIYNSIYESVEIRDVLFVDDLKGYPEEMDLGIVAIAENTVRDELRNGDSLTAVFAKHKIL